jgi:arylformamidase
LLAKVTILPPGRIVDISVGVHPGMLTWPSDPGVEIEAVSRVSLGDPASVSHLSLGSHTGTHVDPPFHFIEHGSTVDELDLDALVGPASVLDLTGRGAEITASDLDAVGLEPEVERILLKTSNSQIWQEVSPDFPDEYTALSPDAAEWLVARGIRLVGTDFLSIERRGASGHPTHMTLLGAGVIIVEGLDLTGVEPGSYWLVCLPLKVVDGDGAPARAILIRE